MTSHAAHLAETVFQHFPYADIYTPRQWTKTRPVPGQEPGQIVICGNGEDQRYVVNMLAQVYPGRPRYIDGELDGSVARQRYFRECLTHLSSHIRHSDPSTSVAFPWKIGCGAAGGDWNVYFFLIKLFADDANVPVVIYQLEGEMK